MLVSLHWLKEYIDIDLTAEELAEKLLLTGTAVESIKYLGEGLKNVVVGQIKTIKKHPNADTLTLCQVDVGKQELQIVCGATNMEERDKVAVALVGTRLPNGVTIKKTNIRGYGSEGMMCSAAELGVGKDASGLLILDPKAKPGESLASVFGLEDVVFELEVTPNRPDCLCMIGVAREIGAITGKKIRRTTVSVKEVPPATASRVQVEIIDPELCPRYVARLITGVKIGPSPAWMQSRLEKAGIRSINNVVDITNYVMLETGQPLHAFDHDRVAESRIIVRRAKKGEMMVTLDGVSRQLNEEMLVIADPKGPVALAGVMGGAFSEVSPVTKNILLESANFNPVSIGRTSRSLGLISEASIRFERGVDPNGALFAADRAAQLMAEIAGGKVNQGAVDVYPKKIEPRSLFLRVQRTNDILGTALSIREIDRILRSIELEVTESGRDRLKVMVPTFRPDLEREIDLIEEVARLYGYHKVKPTLPGSRGMRGRFTHEQIVAKTIREIMVAAGLNEVITYGFIDEKHFDKLGLSPNDELRQAVRIKNPISENQSVMRTTLIPGLLNVVQYNVNRGENDVAVFEMGRVFLPRADRLLPEEHLSLAAVLTGNREQKQWYGKAREADFYDVKGILEELLDKFASCEWRLETSKNPMLHQRRGADIVAELPGGRKKIGFLGELNHEVQAAYDLPARTFILETFIAWLTGPTRSYWQFKEMPKFPAITLDIAAVVDETVNAAEVKKVIAQAGGKLLREIRLFDVYRGGTIDPAKKSLAYSLVFQADDRTLTDEEAKRAFDRIVARLKKELKAKIRTR